MFKQSNRVLNSFRRRSKITPLQKMKYRLDALETTIRWYERTNGDTDEICIMQREARILRVDIEREICNNGLNEFADSVLG